MTLSLTSLQAFAPKSNGPAISEDAAEIRARLHLLLPDKNAASLRELQDYALAYAAHYQRNRAGLETSFQTIARFSHDKPLHAKRSTGGAGADVAHPVRPE